MVNGRAVSNQTQFIEQEFLTTGTRSEKCLQSYDCAKSQQNKPEIHRYDSAKLREVKKFNVQIAYNAYKMETKGMKTFNASSRRICAILALKPFYW